MPPSGRPPGEGKGVGRCMEEAEDVYRFQELETEDEKNGVLLEPGYQQAGNGKQFNPDELYFNGMDLRAWEARTADIDGLAYGDDYDYLEDEGYYDERVGVSMAEYQELLFLRVLDKIRLARAAGDADVELTTEELEAYSRGLHPPRAPAARPYSYPMRGRPVSPPVLNTITNVDASNTVVSASTSSNASGPASGSTRRKRSQQRTSIFGISSRSKKEKEKTRPSSRKRAPSNGSETLNQPLQQPQPPQQAPPGFIVPGPNGPIYAPINAYGRMRRDSNVRSAVSPSRGSRSTSLNGRQVPTPPGITPPREIPGAFPSNSPQRYYRESTPPPRQSRPPSSYSRYSLQDSGEFPPNTRSRSSSIQQPVKLVPFPVTDYQHYTPEPYQYHTPAQPAPLQSSPKPSVIQPQYTRRVASGPTEPNYTTMPRRVPVPVQRTTAPLPVQGSSSDLALSHRASVSSEEMNDDDSQGGVVVDVNPQADDKSYKVQTTKPSGKESASSSNTKDSRKKSSGRTRRKN